MCEILKPENAHKNAIDPSEDEERASSEKTLCDPHKQRAVQPVMPQNDQKSRVTRANHGSRAKYSRICQSHYGVATCTEIFLIQRGF